MPNNLKNGKIVIDPGHGGVDGGNTSPAEGYSYRRALNTRVVIIEKNKPYVFPSIHVNASSRRPAAGGAIVSYNKAVRNASLLSETLQKHLNMVTHKSTGQ